MRCGAVLYGAVVWYIIVERWLPVFVHISISLITEVSWPLVVCVTVLSPRPLAATVCVSPVFFLGVEYISNVCVCLCTAKRFVLCK